MKTKQEYAAQGANDATCQQNRYCRARYESFVNGTSWQAKAYMAGFNSVTAKVEAQVREDHQDKLSDYAVKRIAQHRVVREAAKDDSVDLVQVFCDAAEIQRSVPCVPYTWEGHSHTANQLFWAKSERKRAEVGFRAEDWHSWDDEARYLAGVIIGGHDATIYG
jgi:hypothetical protein